VSHDERFIEVQVHGLAVESKSKAPVLLLRDQGARLLLPIWIGRAEASAIVAEIESRRGIRPMTHELVASLVGALGARCVSLEVYGLRETTFLARLRMHTASNESTTVECRPSDGVAIALNLRIPIRVEARVMSTAQPFAQSNQNDESPELGFVLDDDAEGRARLMQRLEEMSPTDFGEFEM
jgi:uncharacterized protein